MEDKKNYLEIDEYELSRLYRLDGRVDAVQEYIDKKEYPDLDTVLFILGIDTTKMEVRKMKRNEKFQEQVKKGLINDSKETRRGADYENLESKN